MSVKEGLHLLKHARVPLAAQRAQYNSIEVCIFGFFDLLGPDYAHLFCLIDLPRQLLLERVVLEEAQV